SIAAATYGRGIFLLTSKSTGPQTLSIRGHLTDFEQDTEDKQPGHPPVRITTAELDSKPGFSLSAVNLASSSVSVLLQAFKNHRLVEVRYRASGQNSGTILK